MVRQTHKQKYVQDYLLRLIHNGMRCGDLLPTIRELAIRLNVSQMTVVRSMDYLESIGVLKREHGRGTFVGGHELLQNRLPTYVPVKNPCGNPIITFLSPFNHFMPPMYDFTRGIADTVDHTRFVLFNRHVYVDKTDEAEELTDAAEKSAGIILISTYSPAMTHVLGKLLMKNYPLVFLDRWPDRLCCHSVSLDHSDAVRLGMEELYACGHRRIWFLGDNSTGFSSTASRVAAYKNFMRKYGIEAVVFRSLPTLIDRILRYPESRPDAVFTNYDALAYDLEDMLQRHGIRVPEEISLLGFDDDPMPENATCRISSIAQPRYRLGVKAAELLQSLIEHGSEFYIRSFIPGELKKYASIYRKELRQ